MQTTTDQNAKAEAELAKFKSDIAAVALKKFPNEDQAALRAAFEEGAVTGQVFCLLHLLLRQNERQQESELERALRGMPRFDPYR